MKASVILCFLALLAQSVAGKTESKTYSINTADGPVRVTETKITEVSSDGDSKTSETSSLSSSVSDLIHDIKNSKVDTFASDLNGSLVIAVDKTAVSAGIKKLIIDAIQKFPVESKGIKIGLIEYTDRPNTVVSLKQGLTLDQMMTQLDRELSTKQTARDDGKILDYVGLQAAYNELQNFGKSMAPRIIVLLSSGSDADKAKTNEWRQKLMKEWISLSEIYIDSTSDSFSAKVIGKEVVTDKTLDLNNFLNNLIRSYSFSTILHYKKVYGEEWEFYIVLKHYQKLHPTSWQSHIETWFKQKYGSLDKFKLFLSKITKEGETISPEEVEKNKFKKQYGAKWLDHFLVWKYKKLFGVNWEVHYQQHKMKLKFGKNWLSEWEKQQFKNKYGEKWEPHYVEWYFKKYRGATWRYSWMKWQLRHKHKKESKVYIDEFMRWYYQYTTESDKGYLAWRDAVKGLSSHDNEKRFRWFYYNLVFQKRRALKKYTKWLYSKQYGKDYLAKYKSWLISFKKNKDWLAYFTTIDKSLRYSTTTSSKGTISWFKKRFGANWQWHYTRSMYRRKYGRAWRVHFATWLKTEWKKASPERPLRWYKKRFGANWQWHYTRSLYRRKYGGAWENHFATWLKTNWKKASPKLGHIIHRPLAAIKRRLG